MKMISLEMPAQRLENGDRDGRYPPTEEGYDFGPGMESAYRQLPSFYRSVYDSFGSEPRTQPPRPPDVTGIGGSNGNAPDWGLRSQLDAWFKRLIVSTEQFQKIPADLKKRALDAQDRINAQINQNINQQAPVKSSVRNMQ